MEAPQAANGNGGHAHMPVEQATGSSGADAAAVAHNPEEAGEETEISDFDEHMHDGEPASSEGAGNGVAGLRQSYGRKVCLCLRGLLLNATEKGEELPRISFACACLLQLFLSRAHLLRS